MLFGNYKGLPGAGKRGNAHKQKRCFQDFGFVRTASVKDTANITSEIIKRGTKIIEGSIDDGEDDWCYESLSEIYPEVISCNDLRTLTGQFMTLSKTFIIDRNKESCTKEWKFTHLYSFFTYLTAAVLMR